MPNIRIDSNGNHTEIHFSVVGGGKIEIPRRNTLLNGYTFVDSELQGLILLGKGIYNFINIIAPLTNERPYLLGKAQLKDGITNIVCSPITVIACVAFGFLKVMKK